MAIALSDNIKTNAPKPSDDRYGPYLDTTTAIAAVPQNIRYKGLTIGVEVAGKIKDYWFEEGIADADLIEKTVTSNELNLVTPIEGYRNIYYVRTTGDDGTAAVNNSALTYATIGAAASAARADFLANGNQNIVYVFYGVYKEHSITRNNVDIFLENDTIVWTDVDRKSVVNDDFSDLQTDEAFRFKVLGGGRFFNQRWYPSQDAEGINLRNATTATIQAQQADSVQIWREANVAQFDLEGINFIFTPQFHGNKTMRFSKCTFQAETKIGHFRGTNTTIVFEDCEFRVQPGADLIAQYFEVKDREGNTVFNLDTSAGNFTDADTTGKSPQQVLDDYLMATTAEQNLACFTWVENLQGNWYRRFHNITVDVINCTFRIRKENCLGIIFTQSVNSTTGRFNIINGQIIDETTGKNTAAIGESKRLSTALNEHNYYNDIAYDTPTGSLTKTDAAYARILSNAKNIFDQEKTSFAALPVDPSNPSNKTATLWLSDGTGAGEDGDLMLITTNAAGDTNTTRLNNPDKSFLSLTDVSATEYLDQAGKKVVVNATEDGLAFENDEKVHVLKFEEASTQPNYQLLRAGLSAITANLLGVNNVTYRTRLVGTTTWDNRTDLNAVVSYAGTLNASEYFVLEVTAQVTDPLVGFVELVVMN